MREGETIEEAWEWFQSEVIPNANAEVKWAIKMAFIAGVRVGVTLTLDIFPPGCLPDKVAQSRLRRLNEELVAAEEEYFPEVTPSPEPGLTSAVN